MSTTLPAQKEHEMSPIESGRQVRDSEPAIRVRDLRKSYSETEAVRGISLEIQPGEIFAFLGPTARARPPR